MDERSKNIYRASGVLAAESALRMFAQGRFERGQISRKTLREFELASDHLKDRAVSIRDGNK